MSTIHSDNSHIIYNFPVTHRLLELISDKYKKSVDKNIDEMDLVLSKAIVDGIADKNLSFANYPSRSFEIFHILGLRVQVLSDYMYRVLYCEESFLCKNIQVGDVIIEVNGVFPGKFSLENSIKRIFINAIRYQNENFSETIIISEDVILEREYKKLTCSFDVKLQEDAVIIRIYYFNELDMDSLIYEIEKAHRNNPKRIIFDLRDNGGGDFNATLRLIDLFMDNDSIICNLKNSKNECYAIKSCTIDKLEFENILIHINAGTASSAELFAIVLRETSNAIIIGSRSFGKGVVQKFVQINETISVYIPVYEFLSPKLIAVADVGIEPDKKIY